MAIRPHYSYGIYRVGENGRTEDTKSNRIKSLYKFPAIMGIGQFEKARQDARLDNCSIIDYNTNMKTTYRIPWYKKILWKLTPKDQYPDYYIDMFRSPIWFIKGKLHQTKRALLWMRLGFKDRDFDQHYLIEVVRLKLSLMVEWWESGNNVTTDGHAKKVLRELKEALFLIERYQKDEYHKWAEQLMGFEEKYGTRQWVEADTGIRSDLHMMKANTPYLILGSKVFTDREKELYRIDCRKVWEKETLLRNEDKRRFSEIIQRHLEGWWD